MTSPFHDLPRNHFKVIYADPPWGFATFDKRNVIPQRADTAHYEAMTFDDLKALPVRDVAARDCVLHMWVISSHLHRAIELAQAWGFEFKSLGMVWVKTQKGDPDAPKMGMGLWFRQETEVCLLFTRGKPKRTDKGVRQTILQPAREHSRKPDEAAERVMRLSEGPYLELFARTSRPGWTSWGNESDKFDRHKDLTQDCDLEAILG